MKLQAILIASTLTIFSADLVASAWMSDPYLMDWQEYCLPSGSKLSTRHACFDADGPVVDSIRYPYDQRNFDGYYKEDKKSFVVVLKDDQPEGAIVRGTLWQIKVTPGKSKNCVDVVLSAPDGQFARPVQQQCSPGASHVNVPTTIINH
ncbi:uncharacterized protein UTRI_10051 [Ustilago trichophora]|uniref:Uncharacterized protein n=1 Tax=Ustilago trichophora TaxID=86804 RepID=A0A5C3DTI9_9BASI|nr:uncharacterized protein UTRI_10051 [Ustilago trichophora]